MQEVEILVKVLDNKAAVLKKLNRFNYQGIKKTLDVYYFDPKRSSLKPGPKGRLKECFRLRNKDGKAFMTYKVDHFDKSGKWTYSDEHEIGISDIETATKIISHLGLKSLVEIESEKNVFLIESYEIVLEDVKNLGLFLEVEKLSVPDTADITKVKGDIWAFINSLGFKIGEELNLGKPELMLRSKHK